jgi:hypothetical protein
MGPLFVPRRLNRGVKHADSQCAVRIRAGPVGTTFILLDQDLYLGGEDA